MSLTTIAHQRRALVDFFNHGTLPFTGRVDEFNKILAFWKSTPESQALRAALLLGEAGSGKSRLIEEFLPRVVADSGVVVHVKLFPGSSSSIIPLLTRAIRFSASASPLLKRDPEETTGSVTSALQRLARLRPTLLILEDIHLLTDEGRTDFATLMEALAGETLSLLCTARPVELAVRGVLERYLIEEMELPPLGRDDLRMIWRELFGDPLEETTTEVFLEATIGNVLALRSALRGALRSGALEADSSGRWHTSQSAASLAESLRQNIRLLSDGMTAHLNSDERHAATALASLGEVFAREAAEAMIDDAARMIDLLLFKGILVRGTVSVVPLPGRPSQAPLLAFTHTLLHKHLVEEGERVTGRLLRIVADGTPLYSVLPFQLLLRHGIDTESPGAPLRTAMDRALESVYTLERTSDGELGSSLREVIQAMADTGATIWSPDITRLMRARALAVELRYMQHRLDTRGPYHDCSDQLLNLTADPPESDLAEMRITAMRHLLLRKRNSGESGTEVWDDVDTILERFPQLRWSRSYIYFLQTASIGHGQDHGSDMVHRVEERFLELIADAGMPAEIRRLALREVAPNFLWLFGTQEELDRRLVLLAELESITNRNDIAFHLRKIALFDGIGRADEVVRMVDELLPQLREQELRGHLAQCMLIRLSALSSFDLSVDEMESELERIAADAPAAIADKVRERGALRLSRVGVMRGDPDWSHGMICRYAVESVPGGWETRMIVAARAGLIREILLEGYQAEPEGEREMIVQGLGDLLRAPVDEREHHIETIRTMLTLPMISRGGLTRLHVMIAALEAVAREPGFESLLDDLRRGIAEGIGLALVWLEGNRLNNFMSPLLDIHGRYLDPADLQRWRATTTAIEGERQRHRNRERNKGNRLRISMVGMIQATPPNEEPTRLRGARLRTVLGLMVADAMLERPLSWREFCRLASGGEDDPERARKMVSMALLRLREAIGEVTIQNVGESPKLDPDLVEVDLLEADRRLRTAIELARRGSLMQSLPLVVEALRFLHEGVPFPTLYDDMFEALRADFEFRLREAVIIVGGGVLREGDPAGAEEILRRGFEAIPEDEEIADLLCQALEQRGRSVEAGRVRLRMTEEQGL